GPPSTPPTSPGCESTSESAGRAGLRDHDDAAEVGLAVPVLAGHQHQPRRAALVEELAVAPRHGGGGQDLHRGDVVDQPRPSVAHGDDIPGGEVLEVVQRTAPGV